MSEHELHGPRPARVGGRRGPAVALLALALGVGAASAGLALLLRAPPVPAASSSPSLPTPRFGAAMAYDPAARELVLFGGDDRQTALTGTWTWDGRRWTELHPAGSPPGLVDPMLGYDPVSRRLVLTGGAKLAAGRRRLQRGTWTWDGSTWRLARSGELPADATGGMGAALATDLETRQLILVTGAGSCTGFQTWRWDAGRWLPLHPTVAPPPGTLDQLGFDPRSRSLLLFSTSSPCASGAPAKAESVWAWGGTDWGERDRSARAAPPGPGQAAESAAGLLLQTPSGTFLWSGGGWAEAEAAGTEIVDPALAYDGADGQVVLYGGICMSCAAVAPLDETWTWEGSWRLREGSPAPPSPRVTTRYA